MGKCSYCGDNAGLLRSRHRKCQDAYTRGVDRIVDATASAVLQGNPALTDLVNSIARRSYIASDTLRESIMKGWSVAVDRCLEDCVISHEEERLLTNFAERHLQLDDTSPIPAWERMCLGVTIRDLTESRQPSYQQELISPLPVNFQDSETFVWGFTDVELWEERIVEIPSVISTSSRSGPMFSGGHVRSL